MSTNKDIFIAQLNTLAEAINRKAGTEGKKSIPELTEIVNTLLNRAPTGLINITNTNLVDVANFAFAQVVDSDLVPYNIAKNVNILGVTGALDAPEGNIDITDAGITDVREYATARVVDNDLRPENIKQGINILGTVGMVVPRAKPIITNSSQEVSRQGQQGVIHLVESQYNELVELKVGESVSIDLSWLPYEDSSGYFSSNLVAIKLDSTGSEYDAIFIACDFSSESPDSPDFKVRVLVFNLLGFTHLVNYKYIVGSSSSDATADASEILEGATAYVNNKKITGTMPTKAAETFYPSVENQIITSGQYLNGDQVIQGIQVTNLVAENIAKGVVVGVGDAINPARITNVVGTYESYPIINLLTPESTGIFNKAFIITQTQYQTLATLANQEVVKFTWPDVEDDQSVILTYFATKTGSSHYSILGWDAQWFVISESYSWDPQGATIQGLAAVHNLADDTYVVGFFTKANLIDTSNSTATNNDVLAGKSAYSNGQAIVGTIPSLGAQTYEPSTSVQTISGGQYLEGPQTLRAVTTNLSADKILKGQTINIGSAQNPTSIASIMGTAESYPEIDAHFWKVVSNLAYFTISASDLNLLWSAAPRDLVKINLDQTVSQISLTTPFILIQKNLSVGGDFEDFEKDSYWVSVDPEHSADDPDYYISDLRKIYAVHDLREPATTAYYFTITSRQYAVNTSSATAKAAEILKDKTAFVKGVEVVGTMDAPKEEEQQEVVLSFGTGTGSIFVTPTDEQHTLSQVEIRKPDNLSPDFIKAGINIAGIDGTYTSNATATENDILYGKTAFVNGQLVSGQILSLSDTTYFPDIDTEKVIISKGKYLAGDQKLAGITFANLVASNIAAGVTVQVGDTVRGAGSYLTIQGTAERRKPESAPEVILNLATGNQVVEPGENSVYSSVTILKPEYLAPEYIKTNINIAGVIGTYGGEQTPTEEKNVTLSFTSTSNPQIVIPTPGYALSKVSIAKPSELIPANIKAGVTIANIQGTYETPTEEQTVDLVLSGTSGTQIVVPSSPDVVLSKVIINKPQDLVGENIKVGTSIAGISGSFTGDATVTASDIFEGKIAYANGQQVIGTFTTSNLTATSSDILFGKTAFVDNTVITGSYKVLSNVNVLSNELTFETADTYEVYPFEANSTEKVTISKPDNLLPGNIRKDVIIAGITGTYGGETISLQNKTVTFIGSGQEVTADSGYDGLQKVIINGPNNLVAENIASGVTVAGITGTYTDDATATASDLLSGTTAYVSGQLVEGNISKVYATTYEVSASDRIISAGQYLAEDQEILGITTSNLLAENIASGVVVKIGDKNNPSRIVEIAGSHAGQKTEDIKTVTFSGNGQEVVADDPITHTLQKVIINKPSNLVSANIASGVIIAGISGSYNTPTTDETVEFVRNGQTVVSSSTGYQIREVTILAPKNLLKENIKTGVTIAGVAGEFTDDADALAGEIVKDKVAYVKGERIVGTYEGLVPTGKINITDTSEVNVSNYAAAQVVDSNLSAVNIKQGVNILGITGSYAGIIPTGTINITTTAPTNVAAYQYAQIVDSHNNLTAENIKAGIEILGITGSYETPTQEKTVTFSANGQEVIPDSNYQLSKVIINKPSNLDTANIKDTVTIAGVEGSFTRNGNLSAVSGDSHGGSETLDDEILTKDLLYNKIAYSKGKKYKGTYSTGAIQVTEPLTFANNQTVITASTYNKDAATQITLGVETPTVDLSFSGNTIEVNPTANYKLLRKVTINKPNNLTSANIASGVIIAGITGTYDNRKPEDTLTINATALNFSVTTSNSFSPAEGHVFDSVEVSQPLNLAAENIKSGITIAGIPGEYTADATAIATDLRSGTFAYARGIKMTGSMPELPVTAYHPSLDDQTIFAGNYLAGNQVIKGITISGLNAYSIVEGNVVNIGDADDPSCILSITGAAPGSSSVITTTVPLNLGSGNQIVTAPTDKSYSSVTITKPTNFEDYIKDGESIGGMTGNYTSDGTLTGTGTGTTIPSTQLRSGIIAYSKGQRYSGSMAEKSAETFVVATSDRTISPDRYLDGAQLIKGVTFSTITTSDLLDGVVLEIGDTLDSDRLLRVEGSAMTQEQFYTYVNGLLYGASS